MLSNFRDIFMTFLFDRNRKEELSLARFLYILNLSAIDDFLGIYLYIFGLRKFGFQISPNPKSRK